MTAFRSKLNRTLNPFLACIAATAITASVARPSTASPQESPQDGILRLVHREWEAVKKKDKSALGALQAKDYFDFGSDGWVDRETGLNTGWMSDEGTLSAFTIEQSRVTLLDDHTAVVTYRGTYKATDHGKPENGSAYYTDLFQKRNGEWLIVFTQDSNLKCAGM